MKFTTILAIAFCVVAVSAAPHKGGNRSNKENNSHTTIKKGSQTIGSNGSTGGSKGGLLGPIDIGIGNKNENKNTATQNMNIA